MRKLQKAGKVPVCYHCKAIGHVYRTCPLLTQQSQVKRDEPTHIFLKSYFFKLKQIKHKIALFAYFTIEN